MKSFESRMREARDSNRPLAPDAIAIAQEADQRVAAYREAVESALRVMDFEREAANTTISTSDPDGHRQSIADHNGELMADMAAKLSVVEYKI